MRGKLERRAIQGAPGLSAVRPRRKYIGRWGLRPGETTPSRRRG